jgi:AcrR family transcriptional regulator
VSAERAYHHGDLRAALITASFDVLADCGLQRFSVAAVARRAGVSSAAPYRHFPDRAHLLGAVSAAAGHENPRERLAALAGAYVRYVARTGAGFPVIFAAELYDVPDDARREQTRALITTLVDLATATGCPSYEAAIALGEATVAVAHGYVSLFTDGFFTHGGRTIDDIAARATAAAYALIGPEQS